MLDVGIQSRFLAVALFVSIGLAAAHFRPVKLFNWSYKDFGTSAFSDISLQQRQRFADFNTNQCPDNWIHFSDSCYYIEKTKYSLAEAEKRCYDKNATLFVANSQDEWDTVRAHTEAGAYSWIGLIRFTHFEKAEDSPRWQTEGALEPSKLNWLVRPYKPITNGWTSLANCAAHYNPLINWDNAAYTYYYPCSYEYASVCERNSTILDFLNRKFDFEV